MLAGLTGGLACGKSFVARVFAGLGANIIEADELGRDVMQPGGEAFGSVLNEFGRGILGHDGFIQRTKLAELVFHDPRALARLNAIVHPAVRARALAQAEHVFSLNSHAVVVYVAAILIESGAYRDCDKIVLVACTAEQQIARAMQREGASEGDVLARISRQLPLEEKRKLADYVIETAGTKEDTVRQTKLVYEDLFQQSL